jgi:hypothetical protein
MGYDPANKITLIVWTNLTGVARRDPDGQCPHAESARSAPMWSPRFDKRRPQRLLEEPPNVTRKPLWPCNGIVQISPDFSKNLFPSVHPLLSKNPDTWIPDGTLVFASPPPIGINVDEDPGGNIQCAG